MKAGEKKKPRFHMNLGTIVFFVIVIYLVVYVVIYLGKEKLAIYEVCASNITDSIRGTGIVLREEELVSTEQEGYINYYIKDGSKIKKDGIVYTIDTTGKIQSYLNELLQKKSSISKQEKAQVFEDLKTFSESFSDNNFSEIYEAKNNINHDLMSYTDTIIADNKEKFEEKYGEDCYIEVRSEVSGLVSFSSDSLEGLTKDTVTEDDFTKKTEMKDLRSKDVVSTGTPVYRIVTGQDWQLMLSVSKDDYERLQNLSKQNVTTVQVTFHKDNFVTKAPFSCEKKGDNYYIILNFENYVQRYLDQRFLSVELLLSETEGLKIPSSSLVSKEVYKIPTKYLTQGSNSSGNNQINLLTTNKKGEKRLVQQTVTIYREEGDYTLIGVSGLKKGDVISSLDMTETYELKETNQLQGVFSVNRGYAEFQLVEIVERNEDYCIVSAAGSGIVLYDRIILNSNTIEEGQTIY